ncbi:MAG: 50S ribosomal protein L6 [Ignisphaera sp.]|uniref:Large ribosomal subunit protein uL6 n=1 Tax=Ignisphaera aggregans TaxID=334771 RepID=A0A7J3MZE0_9CREN
MNKVVHLCEKITIPDNVKIEINDKKVRISGPKGSIERDFRYAHGIIMRIEENKIVLETFFANSRRKALLYSIASHIENMIVGVTKGWRYKLKIVTSHFPATVKVSSNEVIVENFLGERSPRKAKILEGVKVKVDGKDIVVEGLDIEKVSQTAANIELATRIKDKDRRIFVDGIYIYEKGVAE